MDHNRDYFSAQQKFLSLCSIYKDTYIIYKKMKSDIGLVGLAVMGENLAMNIESRGFRVSLYNRSAPGEEGVVEHFVKGRGVGRRFVATHSVEELVESLESPRKVMLMIKAGTPVDEMIEQLLPLLSPGDVVIDGGNSDYRDTTRRVKRMEEEGIYFVGAGVSGGESGALLGPSIMPGGSAPAWPLVKDILQAIAAKTEEGLSCCEWIGPDGSGHFVKMVHNGIEYGDMQLIAESYSLLKVRLGLDNEAMAKLFDRWNEGDLDSYLVQITADILRYPIEEGGYLLDKILDVAGQKGTGKWSVESALDYHDPLTLITEAVYARMLSGRLDERHKASRLYPHHSLVVQPGITTDDIRQSLYASKLVSYAQGFSLMRKAATERRWNLDYGTIARVWREGCIIRSAFLTDITAAYAINPDLENLLFDDRFRSRIEKALPAWRRVVAEGALSGIALPAMSSALNYFDGLRTAHSAANLIQAQRDYFGAHTYERVDRDRGRLFHTNWSGEGGDTVSTSYTV